MVVYAAATETSVGQLFMAGVIPGLVLGLMLMVGDLHRARRRSTCRASPARRCGNCCIAGATRIWGLLLDLRDDRRDLRRRVHADRGRRRRRGLRLPGRLFVYRDMGWGEVPHVSAEAGKVTVMLMFIIANAMLFAHVLTTERIPQTIAEIIVGWGCRPGRS